MLSSLLDSIAFDSFLAIPIPVWIMAGTFLIALYIQRSTYFGRDVYAVGGNPDAARLSGVNVSRTIIAVYAISGMLAALGGVLQTARIGAASPQVGEAILFDAAAAVLLGGTSFAGGIGGVGGTAVGVLFLATLSERALRLGRRGRVAADHHRRILLVAILLDRIQREGLVGMGIRTGRRPPQTGPRSPDGDVEAERRQRGVAAYASQFGVPEEEVERRSWSGSDDASRKRPSTPPGTPGRTTASRFATGA